MSKHGHVYDDPKSADSGAGADGWKDWSKDNGWKDWSKDDGWKDWNKEGVEKSDDEGDLQRAEEMRALDR